MNHQPDCNCDQCLSTRMQSTNPAERQHAWHVWYCRDAPTLQRFIEWRCWSLHCPAHSEDILQDCFLKGFKNVSSGRYREQGQPLLAYLHGIAKNLLREVGRLQRKEADELALEDVLAQEKITLDDKIHLQELLNLIKEAYCRQPILHQQVVDGLYGEGKSSEEVAVELCTTAGNIRIIAHRTINQIRAYLKQQHQLNLSACAIRACLPDLPPVIYPVAVRVADRNRCCDGQTLQVPVAQGHCADGSHYNHSAKPQGSLVRCRGW